MITSATIQIVQYGNRCTPAQHLLTLILRLYCTLQTCTIYCPWYHLHPLLRDLKMGYFAAFQGHALPNFGRKRTTLGSTARTVCALEGEDGTPVRFRKESVEAVRTSFKQEEKSARMLSPNERILAQVQESMDRLGVAEKTDPPPPSKPLDYSHVSALSALAGTAGAALISAVLWKILQTVVDLYTLHPFTSDIYFVNRITVVVRTAVVGLLALGSGISGVTSLGLLLLFFRVSSDTVSKTVGGDQGNDAE